MLFVPSSQTGDRALRAVGLLAVILPLALLVVLIASTIAQGGARLDSEFLSGLPSRKAELSGIGPALAGTAMLMGLTALIAVPIGLGAALWLEEYARPGRFMSIVELTISTLAGVPSIIYALLALEVFVRVLGMGRSILAGAATLSLLILPMIVMASREALRTVPRHLREASFALGADRWVTLRRIVLPLALPGVLTGVILGLARAIGETAPLITIGAATYIPFAPDGIWSAFTVLPIQIFNWVSRPQLDFQQNAAAGIIVLLALLVFMNATAVVLRDRYQRQGRS
jgi:phosphate transport system permease protein